MKKRIKNIVINLLLVVILLSGCSSNLSASITPDSNTQKVDQKQTIKDYQIGIHFIDVGQADAIYITDYQGNDMMIDAGESKSYDKVDTYLKKYKIDDFEYIIGTHPHADHIGGMDLLINDYSIEKVIMPDVTASTKVYKDVIQAMKQQELEKSIVDVGDVFAFGEAQFTILAPSRNEYKDLNDYSISIKLEYGENSIILTGDAEAESEHEMIQSGLDLKADVLKLGHHGSGSSTTAQFLYKVKPEYVIISVGENNRYGHPDPLVVNRLKKQGIVNIYRTDKNGNIEVIMNGEKVDVSCSSNQDTAKVMNKENIAEEPGIIITEIDKKKELVTIKNTGSTKIDLTGWYIRSVKGNQKYSFPSGYEIGPGEEITITSGSSPADLTWSKSSIWNNSQSDPGELFDGEDLIYRFED